MEYDDVDDKTLVELLYNDLDRHFELLVKRFEGLLYKLACKSTRTLQDAEDVKQDALLKAYRALKNHAKERRIVYLRAWLIRVFNSALIDFYRRTRRIPPPVPLESLEFLELLEEDSRYLPANVVVTAELHEKIMEAINNLPVLYQELAYLYYIEEWSMAELRKHFGVSSETIKSRLRRARNLLRKTLQSDMSEEEE